MIRVLDTETTGVEPSSAVCEIGWCDVIEGPEGWVAGVPDSCLVDPCMPIPPEAMAVHHITDAMVKGHPTLDIAMSKHGILQDVEMLAAHNAKFEQMFITAPGVEWICTYKVAVTLAPNAPSYKNQVLRYWLGLELNTDLAAPPHRAGPDAYVTGCLLARMLNGKKKTMTPEEMAVLSAGPIVLPRFAFGKHAMLPVAEIPRDYLQWILRQADMDEDVQHTARHHLGLLK